MELDFKNARKSAVDAAALSEILTVAGTQNADATLHIGPEGSLVVRTRSIDGVTVIDISASNGFFTGEVPDRPIGIEIGRWLDILKHGKGDAILEWIDGAVRITCGKLSTTLRLELPDTLIGMPSKLAFTATAMLDPAPLKTLIGMIPGKVFSPWKLIAKEEGLVIASHEDTGVGSEVDLRADEMIAYAMEEPADANYPREAWGKILKALPAGPIGVEFKTNFPCKVTFGGDNWSGTWICAPMILEGN